MTRTSFSRLFQVMMGALLICAAIDIQNNWLCTTYAEDTKPLENSKGNTSKNEEELAEKLQKLFVKDIEVAHTFEDVISNESKRKKNLSVEYPDRIERSKVIVEYINIIRPKNESQLIMRKIQEVLNSDKRDQDKYFVLGNLFYMIKSFTTDDKNLWSLIKEIAGTISINDDTYVMIGEAQKCMGMCRVPETSVYFDKAITKEYWEERIGANTPKSRDAAIFLINMCRGYVVDGICNLSAEDAIPKLECLLKELNPDEVLYEDTWRALDEMWRRKKGDPPLFIEYGTRYEYHDPEVFPSEYPEWIYGIGGVKIEWPFGKPPEGYKPPKVHIDPL